MLQKPKYRKVSMGLWADEKVRKLSRPQPNGQSLLLWLITGTRTTNIPGVVLGTPEELAAALRWPFEGFWSALSEIANVGMAKVDREAGVVWLKNAPRHNPPESPNVVRSWRATWDDVPECPLKGEAWHALKAFCEGMGEGFAKAFGEACAKPSPNQDQDQEQEQEQEQDPESDSRPLELELAEPDRPARSPIRAEAELLWKLQEDLRAQTIPKARPLKATEDRLDRVVERLEENTPADCEHVLQVYAADAVRKPDSREWFNGETNWRKANFDRALGRAIPQRDSKPARPAARPVDESEAARLVRTFERDALLFGLVDADGNPT
jgi:hypothetical protein